MNKEHEKAEATAKRRAIAKLNDLTDLVESLRGLIERGYEPFGEDAHRLTTASTAVAIHLSALETLREAREWTQA